MKLNEEIRQVLASYALPAGVVETMADAMARLDANRVAPGIAVGERAPEFRLPNLRGDETSLGDLLAKGPVVLTFFRGEWCPVCNLQLAALQRALPEIRKLGATLAAVSPQFIDHAADLARKHEIEFEILSDVTQSAIRDYRLQFLMPKEVREIYTGIFALDISEQNGDGSWKLPVPGTFVLDGEGVVRVRHVTADFTRRMEPDDVVAALESLQTTVSP